MKKSFKKVFIVFAILIILLAGTTFATDAKIVEPEYTELYKQWLELDEEERQKVIEPKKYNFNNTTTNEETLLANKNITLEKLIKNYRASNYATKKDFSLMELISNNIEIKNQGMTNFCWAFTSISSLETNLALKNKYNGITDKIFDYSEKHMVYSMAQTFKNNAVNTKGWDFEVSDGGNFVMATAYLTNGSGAINELDMEFDNSEAEINIEDIQGKTVQTTVNDVRYFDSLYVLKDSVVDVGGNEVDRANLTTLIQEMKQHISTNGSIYAGIYMPPITGDQDLKFETSAIYCQMNTFDEIEEEFEKKMNGEEFRYANHAISIIGWDDEYGWDEENQTSKFATTPNNLGAWIIRNSYGTEEKYTFDELKQIIVATKQDINDVSEITDEILQTYLDDFESMNYVIDKENQTISLSIGEEGLFYVSYEDAYIYSNLMGIESADAEKTYLNLYQHDDLGGASATSYEGTMSTDIYLANVFERKNNEKEYLTSIGFESLVDGIYEVYINPTDAEKTPAKLKKAELTTGENSITLTAGYHTIDLKNAYELTGSKFVIAIKMKHDGQNYQFFTYEDHEQNKNIRLSKENESFITFEGYSKDIDWVDIGNPNNTQYYKGNLCIKGITVNEVVGSEEDKPIPPEEDKKDEEDQPTDTEEDKKDEVTDDGKDEEIIIKNSNFNQAEANLTELELEYGNGQGDFSYTIQIKGIKVDELNDKYEHYYYLSENNNLSQISNEKWSKVKSFEKQSDGTYTLTIIVDKEEQLKDVENDKTIYIYIKEIATKGTQSATIVTDAIELKVDLSMIDKENQDDEEIVLEDDKDIEFEDDNDEVDEDKTLADKILPDTGITKMIILIFGIFIIAIIIYKKCKNYEDIK